MAKTLAAHRMGLLAYYRVMISSELMEGTNNKIKTMKGCDRRYNNLIEPTPTAKP
jgi:transposase